MPLGDLDPVKNVSLTDAGLTPYHAIKMSLPKLGAGATAMVIGAGGLGHVGIQILKALSAAQVIAVDLSEQKLVLAKEVGADHAMLSDDAAASSIRELTNGRGAEAVFDFVGAQPTVELAGKVIAETETFSLSILGRRGDTWGTLGRCGRARDQSLRRCVQ